MSTSLPIKSHRPLTVCSPIYRSMALRREKAFSIGLKSGLYGGRTHYVTKLPECVIAMEACCGVHKFGRLFAAHGHGHEIRLTSPEYVRPYVKAQNNDDRDAEGIAEAASRPTMRFVELKTQEQLDIQILHRIRS